MHFPSEEAIAAYFRTNPELSELKLENCPPSIKSIPSLPIKLTHLSAVNCPGLKSLPQASSNLTNVVVRACPSLSFVHLAGLSHLLVEDCAALTRVTASSKVLRIRKCPALLWLSKLPETLTHLELDACPRLPGPSKLPSSLNFLKVKASPFFTRSPLHTGSLTIDIR